MKYEKTRAYKPEDVEYKITRRYLKDVIANEHLIEGAIAEKEHQEARLELLGINFDEKVSTTPNTDPFTEGVAALNEYRNELGTRLAEYRDIRSEASKVIAKVAHNKPHAYDVLCLRYLREKKFAAIAEELEYTLSHTHRLHREGLWELYRHIPREYKQRQKRAWARSEHQVYGRKSCQ